MIIQVRSLNKNEIDIACALLYKEYIQSGLWQFSDNNPSELKIITRNNRKLLVDRITPYAIWFGAFHLNKLVGCIRLFKSTDSLSFEMEQYLSAKEIVKQYIDIYKPNIYEGTRACVHSKYKGNNILQKLYLSILEYAEKDHCSIFGSASNEYIKSVLKRIEWPCKKAYAFKFEETDPAPVNFYLADYEAGEVKNIIQNIRLLEKKLNRKSIGILDALEVVANIFPAPMYWHDTKGTVIGINSLCLRDMGKSLEMVLGKTPYDFYPRKIADHIWRHSEQVMRTGETMSQEEYSYNDLGECIGTYLAIKTPLYDEEDNIIGIMGTSIDITAEKEAERLRVQNIHNEEKLASQEIFKNCVNDVMSMLHLTQIKLTSINNNALKISPEDEYIELTPREKDIVYLLSLNQSPKEIANFLSDKEKKPLSPDTIRGYINKQLYPKFGVYSVKQLIEKARLLKLIPFVPDNFLTIHLEDA